MIAKLIIISAFSFFQKDTIPPKPDSVQVIMNEFLVFLQDKITVKEYIPVQQMVATFLKSKEFIKPKK